MLTQTYAGDNGVTPTEATVYDANVLAASVNSSRFGTQQYRYDEDGRLMSTTEPSGGGVTSAAQIAYSYYGNGKRSAVSITSSALNQSNALTYSYRADGQMQTQAVNAFASGTWTRDYTDTGRLRSIAGAGAPTRTYDATGQLQSYTVVGQAISYTHDPQGSVLSEAFPSVWPAGATAPISMVRYSTINVRGELIDDTPPRTAPRAWATAHRNKTDLDCMGRQTVTSDGSYDPAAVPDQYYRQCVVTGNESMTDVPYNGSSYPSGRTTQFAFDAAGRLSRTIDDRSTFFGGDTTHTAHVPPLRRRPLTRRPRRPMTPRTILSVEVSLRRGQRAPSPTKIAQRRHRRPVPRCTQRSVGDRMRTRSWYTIRASPS